MQTTKTAFVGRISTSSDARNAAFRVKVYVGDDTIDIVSPDGDEWTWQLDDVNITRSSVDRFLLELADETLYFLPVDTRGFTRDVVERLSGEPVEPHRGWLRRRIEAAQAEGGSDDGYSLEIDHEIEEGTTGKRGHLHEWQEGSAVGVLTRRCVKCGQVSIDATGLTSELTKL